MFRSRLAQLALVAGLGLVSGCSSCYSFSLGAPAGGGGLFGRFHQNPTPAAAPADCACTGMPGCGCASSPCCDGPILEGMGAVPGMSCGSGLSGGPLGGGPLLDGVQHIPTTPRLVPAPSAPTFPYAP